MAKKYKYGKVDRSYAKQSVHGRTVLSSEPLWTLQSADGEHVGNVSWGFINAVQNGTIDSYKPKDNEVEILEKYKSIPQFELDLGEENKQNNKVSYNALKAIEGYTLDSYTPSKEEEKALSTFRSLRNIPVYDEAKRKIGSISYDASIAFQNLKLDEYKPKDEAEKNVIANLRKEPIIPLEVDVDGQKKYFGNLSYDDYMDFRNNTVDESTLSDSGKATLSNYFKAPIVPLKIEVDGKEKTFGKVSLNTLNLIEGNGGFNFASIPEGERQAVRDYSKYINANYGYEEPDNFWEYLEAAPYTIEKLGAGVAGGIENLFYGGAALFGKGFTELSRGLDKVIPGDGSFITNTFDNGTKAILGTKTVGETLSEDAESRFRVPDWYRQYIGSTAEGFGNLLPAMATEYFTAGASPLGDMALAKVFAQATAKKTLVNTIKTSLTTIKPSDIVFSGSAMGSAAKTAYKQTGDVGKSLNYGILNGLGEFATERLFGGIAGTGIGAGGKTVTSGSRILKILDGADDLFDVTKIKGVSKLASTKFGKKVLDIAFEGVEEMIMADLDPWIQRATINPDAKSATWKERGESFFQGILLSGFSNAATYSYGKVRNIPNIKELNVEAEKINATLPDNVNKLQPLKLTASGKKIIDRAKDIQRIKGINDVNRVSDAINAMMKYDKDKLELLTYDASIDEIEKRQEQIGVFATGYADLMAEELVKNNPEAFNFVERISIGQSFVDAKTGYKVTVINRDAEKTTVEINTGKNIITKAFSNNQADRFATSEQMIEIDDTSVVENTTVDEYVPNETQTVSIGDTFRDTKTGNTVKVIDRDANKTTVSVVMSDGVKVKPMTNTEFDNVLSRGQLERVEPVKSTPSVADTTEVTAKAEEPIRDINLKRVGRYYEAYGEEAQLLAEELDLETTKVIVNGVETDMLRLPADLTKRLAKSSDEYNLILSDKPTSENATVTDETTSTDEVTPSAEENATEGENSNVANAIEETQTETLKNESESDTMKSSNENDSVERKDDSDENERSERTVEERTVRNVENVERTDGERTGRSSERVSGKTGNAQKTETERTTRKKVATATFDEVKRDYYTPEMKSLEKGTYDKYGVVVKYFYGECIDDSGAKGDAFYYNGVLYIQADDETSLESRIDHEITHHFGKSNAMTKFRNAVKAKMPKAEYDSWYAEIKEAYGDVLVRYLSKELKNSNYTLTDAELQQLMDEYIEEEMLANLNGEQVPFATEYRAEIEAFRKEIGNYNTKSKATSESKTSNTPAEYSESIDAGGKAQKNTDSESGDSGVRYSIREEYVNEIEAWEKDEMPEGETFILGTTGDALQGLGAIESDIYMLGDKIIDILNDHPEMTIEEIKKIPQILENPILILKSKNVGRDDADNSRLVIFGNIKAKDGRPILSVLDLKPVENHLAVDDMQKVSSAYTKDVKPVDFVKESLVVYADKKRTTKLLRTIGFKAPIELQLSGYIGRITYPGQNVNIEGEEFSKVFKKSSNNSFSPKDNQGNTLTKEQQEYFKDSKVRDENGVLKVVYHGTRKADFTVFKRNINFFTDSEEMADSYSPNSEMYKGYLNITKPYEIDARGEKWSKVPIDEATKEFLQEYGASVFKESGKWRTTPADIAAAIEEAVDNGELDYDGIIIKNIDDTGSYYKGKGKHLGTDYITFNSNQFKNADNTNPTSKPDIRYSISKEKDTAYMKAVKSGDTETASKMIEEAAEKAFANSKVREDDGKLKLVYHGRVSDFNVFDRSFANVEGDFGKGYYFTSNEYDVDENYANEKGPDLENKIARLAERLEWEDEYSDLSYEEREEIARQRFITSEPNTITAYLNMENPVYITPDEKGTFLDFNEAYDEEYDEYGEPEGLFVDFIEALKNNSYDYAYNDVDFSFLYEYAYDNGGMYASDAVKIIKERIIDELSDENGDIATNEVIRLAFEEIGFDGIIDTSVYYKFNNMNGMDSGTTHYIVFDSEQIKSADIATYDDNGNVIPLSERFNTKNKDIRFSLKQPVEETKDLVAVHNLNSEQLMDVMSRGQFIMPSMAVTNKGHFAFGDISVLFSKDTIDPKNNAENKLYGSDAWTPTQTRLKKNPVFDNNAVTNILKDLKRTIGGGYSQIFDMGAVEFRNTIAKSDGSIYDAFSDNIGLQSAYALENNLIPKVPKTKNGKIDMALLKNQLDAKLDNDTEWRNYKKWLGEISDTIITSYDKASNEDIINNMKSQPDSAKRFKLGENGELTVPAVEYNSIDEYKSNKHRLSEDVDVKAKEVGQGFISWANNIGAEAPITDVITAINSAFDNRYNANDIINKFAENGIDLTRSEAQSLQNLYRKAVELPTPYFEAKPKRAVGLDEVAMVVLPDTVSEEVKTTLDAHSIPYTEYVAKDKQSRVDAVNAVEGVRFSLKDSGGNNLETQKKIESIAKEINSHDELVEVAKKNTQEFVDKIKENKSLQKRLKNAKGQMLLSPKPIVNIVKVGKVTNDILKEMDSTLKATDLKDEIISIYTEYFDNIKKASGVESKTQEANDNMMKRFANLAINIAESAEAYAESEEYLSLKSYLKDVRIKVPESAKSDVHYAEFRKSHRGTFNLTNDGLEMDVVYQELCDMFPGMFDENITHPADQLNAIAEKYESLKPYAYNPHLEYMQDAIDHIVYRFASEVDGIATSPKTKAQKIAEKGAYDKEMALEKERASFERKLERHKKNSENIINKLQKKIGESEYVRYWEKRLSKEEKQEAIQEIRDNQKKAVLKSKIRSIVADMRIQLNKSENSGGYPKELVKAAAEVLSAIDFHSGKTNKDGSLTKETIRLDALKVEYDALKNNKNYDFQSEYSEELSNSIDTLRKHVKDKRVIDLTSTELSELKDILSEIKHKLSKASVQISKSDAQAEAKKNVDIATEIINRLKSNDEGITDARNQLLKEMRLAKERGKAFVINPHRVFEMIANYDRNSEWWQLYDQILRGSRDASKFTMDANKPFDELTDGGGNEIAFYDFRTKNIKTGIKYQDGSEVEIPKSIICELVMLWDRKQGRNHLETGGAKIPDLKLFNKGRTADALTAGKQTRAITQSDITRLKGMLDSYDKAWIERSRYLFNKTAKDAINETSMVLLGREIAKANNYIRIYVDSDFVRKDIGKNEFDITIEGHGSLKETTPDAKNPVVLRGLHENVFEHIDFAARYYGLAIPIRNFNKVYKIAINDGGDFYSVKSLLGNKFGSKIRDGVVVQTIKDLQSPRQREISFFNKVRGRWLTVTFFANIRSTLKQTTSYLTASAVLGEDSLAKGLTKFVAHPKQTKAEIAKYSGTLYKRSQGLSTTELGDRANRKRLAGLSSKTTKVINKVAPWLRKVPEGIRPGNWLQSMDVNTSAALWEACKVEVAKTIKVSDDRYMKSVADLYERVIEETQSNYDVLHRPEVLKSTSEITKTISMFQNDSLQQSGILFSAFGDYNAKRKAYKADESEKNEQNLKDARKRMNKAIRSRIYSSMWLVLVSTFGDALLRKFKPYIDEEDKEITSSSVLEQMMLNMAEDTFGVFVPVYGQLVTKAMDTFNEGYDFLNDPSFDVMEDFIKATSKIWDAYAEDGDVLKALVDAVPAISNMTGIPAKNISDLYKSVKGYMGDIKAGEFAHDLEDYTSGNKSFYSYGDLASYIASGDKEKETKWKDYYSANGKDFAKGSLTKEIKPAYVQTYIDFPEKAYNLKRKLILDYDYLEADIDGWLIDGYLDNVVSEPEYAAEIKSVLSNENKWNTTSVFKATKSYYKKVYKDGDEKKTKALREALLDDGVVTKANLDVWENQADNEIKNQEKKLDAEKEKFKE